MYTYSQHTEQSKRARWLRSVELQPATAAAAVMVLLECRLPAIVPVKSPGTGGNNQ